MEGERRSAMAGPNTDGAATSVQKMVSCVSCQMARRSVSMTHATGNIQRGVWARIAFSVSRFSVARAILLLGLGGRDASAGVKPGRVRAAPLPSVILALGVNEFTSYLALLRSEPFMLEMNL